MAISAVTAVVAVAGAVAADKQASKARRLQREALAVQKENQKLEQQKADIQAARSRREEVRKARIRRAQLLSDADTAGASGGSAVSGSVGSIGTQLGVNLGTQSAIQGISGQQSQNNIFASGLQSQANSAQARGQQFGQISSLASQNTNWGAIGSGAQNIFKGP